MQTAIWKSGVLSLRIYSVDASQQGAGDSATSAAEERRNRREPDRAHRQGGAIPSALSRKRPTLLGGFAASLRARGCDPSAPADGPGVSAFDGGFGRAGPPLRGVRDSGGRQSAATGGKTTRQAMRSR